MPAQHSARCQEHLCAGRVMQLEIGAAQRARRNDSSHAINLASSPAHNGRGGSQGSGACSPDGTALGGCLAVVVHLDHQSISELLSVGGSTFVVSRLSLPNGCMKRDHRSHGAGVCGTSGRRIRGARYDEGDDDENDAVDAAQFSSRSPALQWSKSKRRFGWSPSESISGFKRWTRVCVSLSAAAT